MRVCCYMECGQEKKINFPMSFLLAREEDFWTSKKRIYQEDSKHNPEVYCI